jgi:hypothetical protein
VPSSSGTSLSAGAREWLVVGLRILSAEPLLLSDKSLGSWRSFRRLFIRSISSCPLSRVKERNALKFSRRNPSNSGIAYPQISSYFVARRTRSLDFLNESVLISPQLFICRNHKAKLTSRLETLTCHIYLY